VSTAHWISDGTEVPAVPLKAPKPRREWRFGRYEIALAPRRGRWSCKASDLTGVAGYRTLIGALLAARRVARRES
jgi:hypothetical protein